MPSEKEYDRKKVMDTICALMAEGQSLRRVCASVEGMPKHSTVMNWCRENSEIANQYARAREQMTDVRFEDFRDSATAIVQNYIDKGWEPKDAIAIARLECGNIQWELSKLAPKKYGDRITQEQIGDPERPIIHRVERVIVDPIHDGASD